MTNMLANWPQSVRAATAVLPRGGEGAGGEGRRPVRIRISLRNKLLIFAILIAVVPLVVAGRSMIRIAQDELKSSANGELAAVAEQLVSEINDRSERTWLAPLLLIRNALDDQRLGVQEKIALLTLGI